MVRNVLLVARRDFLAVVRTKGFLFGLIFLPGVILASVGLPKLFERFSEQGERRFVVADFTGRLAAPMEQSLAVSNLDPTRKLKVVLEDYDLAAHGIAAGDFAAAKEHLKDEFARRARAGEIYGFVLIGPRALELPPAPMPFRRPPSGTDGADPDGKGAAAQEDAALIYGARSLTAGDMRQTVRDAAREAVRSLRMQDAGVDAGKIARIDVPPAFDEFVIGKKEGEVVQSSGAREGIAAMGVVILILMGVMQSAGMLLNSTIEEKGNRVVEVMVSSVSSFELLAGKIFGAWLVGLTMMVAWGGSGFVAADHFGVVRASMFSGPNLAWYLYFFITGYLLFASVYAAVGAMCSSIQDAQSLMFPIVILIMIPMMSLAHVMQHPDSVLSLILTWFPFSAPFIAVLRLALSPPAPQWQIAIAAVSVAFGAWLMMWMGGKVFRIAIFMSGKPPKPGEILRWLREA
jgi:ABC-2 type transport system permease protein